MTIPRPFTSVVALFWLLSAFLTAQAGDFFLSQWIQPVPRYSVLTNAGYYVWGGSVVQDSNQYHMFYERWPTNNGNGFGGWVTSAEIAHAVADNPAGPFITTGVVLGKRPNDTNMAYWDSQSPRRRPLSPSQ